MRENGLHMELFFPTIRRFKTLVLLQKIVVDITK
jgi:hypothetical protein